VTTATSQKHQSRKDLHLLTTHKLTMGFLAVAGCMLLADTMSAVLTQKSTKA
tara:strand:- start:884 stop:1039 length:156 start_codon:yes stop_codon:yes gene_type:complete